jgi:predicted AlkP superfamily phosphohydrolase/phosphomutase
MQKVVIIGLDGGTLDLMEEWMDRGYLPNFDKIRKEGVYGNLISTIPCYSAPAWVSIVTGCNPGKHGIYDFFRTDIISKKLVNSRYRKVPAIWNILTDNKKKSIVVNVPGTYPPEPIKGIMITGLLTPSPESDFTYPKNIKKELVEGKIGKYELEQVAIDDVPKSLSARYAPEQLVSQINKMTVSHATVTINLMKKYDWDFAMVVFRGTDDAQHLLWDKKELILSCYKKADEYLGKMMQLFPDALFIVVSDHGFQEAKKYLYVNNFLYNAGFLKTYSPPTYSIDNLMMTIFNKISKLLFYIFPVRKFFRSPIGRRLIMSSGASKNIDISRTQALYHSICSRGIRINLKNKYEYGIVDKKDYKKLRKKLVKLFKEIKDPDTGKNVVKDVYYWEKIYGKDAKNDPLDIILELEDGYGAQELLRFPERAKNKSSGKGKLPILASPGFYDWIGDHAPKGILFMYGKNIKSNYKLEASVVDIVPTILAAMNIPIPNNIDGKVIEEAFIEKPKVKREVPKKKELLTSAEIKAIKKLRSKI